MPLSMKNQQFVNKHKNRYSSNHFQLASFIQLSLLLIVAFIMSLSSCSSTGKMVSAFTSTTKTTSSLTLSHMRSNARSMVSFSKVPKNRMAFHVPNPLAPANNNMNLWSMQSCISRTELLQKMGTFSTALQYRLVSSESSNDDENVGHKSNIKSSTGSVFPSFNPIAYSLPDFPSIVPTAELKKNQRIVTFGDVHGDINALTNFLKTAQIMDPESTASNPKWSGSDTICVQCGDILDRGDDELACLRLLTSLARQAAEQDGALVMCYGNHEALNSVGLFQYANDDGNQEFESYLGQHIDQEWKTQKWRLQFANNQPSRWAAFEPGGLFASQLLSNMKVAVVVGRTVFVHGGLTKEHIGEYGSIAAMNQNATEWIMKSQHGDNNNLGTYTKVEDVIEAAQSRAKSHSNTIPSCLGGGIGASSPVWMRDYSQPHDLPPSNPMAQRMINEALDTISSSINSDFNADNNNVVRMVMGHTPQMKINAALNGKAWRVDVGASRGVMGGNPEVLEIIHGGEDEDDLVSILTMTKDGIEKIDAKERHLIEMPF